MSRKRYTQRGFSIQEFKDIYGDECSIQKSSLATKDAIWLGCDEPLHDHCTNTYHNRRMHVDKKLTRWLIKKLQKFVKTGDI